MPTNSDEEYGSVARSRLKLKLQDAGVEKKKKKKHKKHKKEKKQKMMQQDKEAAAEKVTQSVKDAAAPAAVVKDTRTAAEKAHARVVEARLAEQLLKKAEKSHKERIMEFNTKLENCSEHFDIPKLSWTK